MSRSPQPWPQSLRRLPLRREIGRRCERAAHVVGRYRCGRPEAAGAGRRPDSCFAPAKASVRRSLRPGDRASSFAGASRGSAEAPGFEAQAYRPVALAGLCRGAAGLVAQPLVLKLCFQPSEPFLGIRVGVGAEPGHHGRVARAALLQCLGERHYLAVHMDRGGVGAPA
jgi:hypothetical protein